MFRGLHTLVTYISVVLAVAFFTLLERKVLSYIQIRKGPNKVSFIGLLQPLADAGKLLIKEGLEPTAANFFLYLAAPILSFILALLIWNIYPYATVVMWLKWGILYFLCVSSLNVYGTLLAGWSSNSKYRLLGALRGIAQTISYEIRLALILLFFLILGASFDFFSINESQEIIFLILLMPVLSYIWLATCVAEVNRAPFDFAEGESELVSGFNTEYRGGSFALIFLAEYASILVIRIVSSILILGGLAILGLSSNLILTIKLIAIAYLFLWLRASYPRYRYDLLIALAWKGFLPFSLCLLWGVFGIYYFIS